MEIQSIPATKREGRGKGAARQLRMAGQIPAVVYGGSGESTPISVSPRDLAFALRSDWRRNVTIELDVEGTTEKTMIKELVVHPVTREFIHADFYRVTDSTELTVKVPLETVGRAIGVQKGGRLQMVFRELPVIASPATVPAKIVIDVANLELLESLSVADINLPEGVRVNLDPKRTVVSVIEARGSKMNAKEEAAEGAEGEEAAKE